MCNVEYFLRVRGLSAMDISYCLEDVLFGFDFPL